MAKILICELCSKTFTSRQHPAPRFCSRRCYDADRIRGAFDIEARVNKVVSGCWLWTGKISSTTGYGKFSNRDLAAHRVSWELHRGPIPDGLCVLHKCDVRHCVNPDHLFLGTSADNIADAKAKGRMSRGGSHYNAKLVPCQIPEIRNWLACGITQKEVAYMLGVHIMTINDIHHRRTWAHIP